jgi:hypothetical protein
VALQYDRLTRRSLQLLDQGGTVLRSFGDAFVEGSERIKEATTQGVILCLRDSEEVVVATIAGWLIAYSGAGEKLWSVPIPDFAPIEIREIGGGVSFTYAPPPRDTATAPHGLFLLNDSTIVLQMRVQTRQIADGKLLLDFQAAVETRLIDRRSGDEVWRTRELPEILSMSEGLVLVTGEDPTPWVALHRLGASAPPPRFPDPGDPD